MVRRYLHSFVGLLVLLVGGRCRYTFRVTNRALRSVRRYI